MVWLLHFPIFSWRGPAAARRRRFWGPAGRSAVALGDAGWRRDPLAHPALRGMTQRELGDLPFDPYAVDAE
jgi:hypothetical protein